MLLRDCGPASIMTRGQVSGLYSEIGSPPWNKSPYYVCVPWDPNLCPFPHEKDDTAPVEVDKKL